MATIQKRMVKGKTVYRVLVRRKGYPVQSATFQKPGDARKWAQATEVAISEGRYFKTFQPHTVAELIDRYIREVLPRKRPSTVPNQVRQLHWWKQQLGYKVLSDLTPSSLVEHRDQLGRKFSNSTVNRYVAVISHALTVAVKEWHWMDANPCHKLSKLREPRAVCEGSAASAGHERREEHHR